MAESSAHAADQAFMRRALELAAAGEGAVEPNPMVGSVVVRDGVIIGEGYHAKYGGPHAEVAALAACQESPRGATLYVTLEPCRHFGKTPPCVDAILKAGIARVVAAMEDPFPEMRGKGIAALREAGVEVRTGVLESEARSLLAPYLKRVTTGKPWVIAKWAMTLDGKIAARDGGSKWITGEAARAVVHKLRGRVDGILVGGRTARRDDPLLTCRPPGLRTPTRVIFDRSLQSPRELQVIRTAKETPTLFVAGPNAPSEKRDQFRRDGVEVLQLASTRSHEQIEELLRELGRRNWTNLIVEGGGEVLGAFFDSGAVDEVHAFIAPKLVGGADAPSPIGGEGVASMMQSLQLDSVRIETIGVDVYVHGRLARNA